MPEAYKFRVRSIYNDDLVVLNGKAGAERYVGELPVQDVKTALKVNEEFRQTSSYHLFSPNSAEGAVKFLARKIYSGPYQIELV